MVEISRIEHEGDKQKVSYDFKSGIFMGQNLSFHKILSLEEYTNIKNNTINRAKKDGWKLTFETVKNGYIDINKGLIVKK